MPRKNERYSRIEGLNLRQWALDYMSSHGIKTRKELAKILGVYEGRAGDVVLGRGNTLFNLEAIVRKVHKGDYSKMSKYADSPEAREVLRELHFKNGLKGEERELYTEILTELKRVKRKQKLYDALKAIKRIR